MRAMIVAGVLCACGCGGGAPQSAVSQASEPDDPGSGARYVGQQTAEKLLADVLVAPASASYPWETIRSREISRIEGNRAWSITGAVDSQNRLGAMIRGQWRVIAVLLEAEGQWVPVYLGLDGEHVWGDPSVAAGASPNTGGAASRPVSAETAEAGAVTASPPTSAEAERAQRARERSRAVVDQPADPEPEPEPVPAATDFADDPADADDAEETARRERIAAGKLRLAKQSLERRNAALKVTAERLLREIVEDYGDTESAAEAQTLLDEVRE